MNLNKYLKECLKPCPFCGEPVTVTTIHQDRAGIKRLLIDCSCGVEFDVEADAFLLTDNDRAIKVGLDAIEKWNRRVEQ